MSGSIDRREFLQSTLTVGAATAISGWGPLAQLSAQTPPATPGGANWFDRPMRWAQLTLAENDPGTFDLKFWLDYFARTHSDAACLSAGGCVAYYPTEVPLHHRSIWLGNGDPFGELMAGCRKLGMNILARTDSHAIHQNAADAHPEWIAVEANGQKRKHWSSPELWVTCALGPYSFDFMSQVHKEIMTRYMPDGIFTNRWSGSGMCYCQSCADQFRKFSGQDLPRGNDPADPVRRKHNEWVEQRLFELWKKWDSEIRAINPHARYVANAGGGALSELNMKTIGGMADILFADRQARRGLMEPWANGKNGKEYRATMGMKPIGGIFSVGLEEAHRWKDSVQSEPELKVWMADGVANGLRPWFTKFAGSVYDKRWLGVVEDFYKWHHSVEKYLRNTRSLARVGMVYSQQTALTYGGSRPGPRVEDHTLGMYQSLVENRIPFEMVHDELLDEGHLSPFKLLILPNIAALSNKQCEQIRAFVRRGGSLLATHETSLFDETGKPRGDFGLANLFGAKLLGPNEGPMQNSYLQIEDPRSPLLAGLGDTTRVINGVNRVDCIPSIPLANIPLTLIPAYPNLPMEMVYPRHTKPGSPQLYTREFGDSRVVYFPWDIDRTYWEVLSVDHGTLLRNALKWAYNGTQPAAVTGQGMLDVTVWEQAGSLAVHLVNLTNPMLMKGPMREIIPAPPQEVEIELPMGKTAGAVKLLVSGATPQVTREGRKVKLTVTGIQAYEVVAVEYA